MYRLLATSRTVPVSSWPCLTKRGVSRRHLTWYQWVSGSVGAVDNQTVEEDPKNATSNQKAKPWTNPDCSTWNSRGISITKARCYNSDRYSVEKHHWPIRWRSDSGAVRKSTTCLTDFAVQMRISKVSTIGCRKYSFIAAFLKQLKSTPWKLCWYLKQNKKSLVISFLFLDIFSINTRNWLYWIVPCTEFRHWMAQCVDLLLLETFYHQASATF